MPDATMTVDLSDLVTRDELDARLQPISSMVDEVRGDVKTLLMAHATETATDSERERSSDSKFRVFTWAVTAVLSAAGVVLSHFHI